MGGFAGGSASTSRGDKCPKQTPELTARTNRAVRRERRLGARAKPELPRKGRGMRRATPLTQHGRRFLPHAVAFLERARELAELFQVAAQPQDGHVAASQYLIRYVL